MTKVLVLLSGGVDSSTVLALAKASGAEVLALAFDYGQRHRVELEAARVVAEHYEVPLRVARFSPLSGPGDATYFTPGRNLIFLALGSAYAASVGATEIHFGANADDAADYPDCRPDFIAAAQVAVPQRLVTPLLYKTKVEVLRTAVALGVPLEKTWTCYEPIDGKQCGRCNSCRLRNEAIACS